MPNFAQGREIWNANPADAPALWSTESIDGHLALAFDGPESEVSPDVTVRFNRFGPEGRFLGLRLIIAFDESADVARGVVALVEAVAKATSPLYGEATDVPGLHELRTRLDLLLGRTEDDSVAEALAVLRGYEWVTVCPQRLADRLGGEAALRATGAFYRVAELPGCVVLQATEQPGQFDADRAGLVWQALRPVLPAGKPHPIPVVDFSPLVMRDAATGEEVGGNASEPVDGAFMGVVEQWFSQALDNGWLVMEDPTAVGQPAGEHTLSLQTTDGRTPAKLTAEGRQRLDDLMREHGLGDEARGRIWTNMTRA